MGTEIQEIDPLEAHALLAQESNARLIDVRSKMEFDYVGHPVGAIHLFWKEFPEWLQNPNFVAAVGTALKMNGVVDKTAPLLVICRSGVRSRNAGESLLEHGYTRVYNVNEGFEGDKDDNRHRGNINGWRFHRLPWEQG